MKVNEMSLRGGRRPTPVGQAAVGHSIFRCRSVGSAKQSQPEIASASLGTLPRNDLQTRLLKWYHTHKRLLPWRLDGNPYRIFVVEVMLQQTQIKTVLPYYERWMKTFPDVRSLAQAPLDKVLKLWEGLGYYTRARNLHKAAKVIVRQFNGLIPSDVESLMSLPGIGRYTAGAVSSIAYQKPVPLVDGNVMRVFARLFNLKDDISKPATTKKFYKLADGLIDQTEPGNFNQGLMELGSLVCTPDAPNCPNCPVHSLCISYQKGNPAKLPVRSTAPKIKKMEMVVGLLRKKNCILVRRRADSGIWGGLWELPGTVRKNGESLEEALRNEFEREIGVSFKVKHKLKSIEHRFTHRLAKIHPFECRFEPGRRTRLKSRSLKWANRKMLKKLSFPVPHQKILIQHRMLLKYSGN